jgi:hypothetical protein
MGKIKELDELTHHFRSASRNGGLPRLTTQSRRLAGNALECAAESGLRGIAQALRHLFNR